MSTCPPLKPVGALNIKKGWSHKREIEVKYLGFVLNLNFKSHDKWIQMLPTNLNFLKMIVEQFDIWPVLSKVVNLQMGSPLSSHAVELRWVCNPPPERNPQTQFWAQCCSRNPRVSARREDDLQSFVPRMFQCSCSVGWEPIQGNAVVVGSFPSKQMHPQSISSPHLLLLWSMSPIHSSLTLWLYLPVPISSPLSLSLSVTLFFFSLPFSLSALGKLAAFNEFHRHDSTACSDPYHHFDCKTRSRGLWGDPMFTPCSSATINYDGKPN